MDRKILVTVDGSVHSNNTLEYLSQLFVNQKNISFELISFVFLGTLPSGHELLGEKEILNIVGPKIKSSVKTAEHHLSKGIKQLVKSGISDERCSSRVKLYRANLAASIINEARAGYYDSLVIGRRGLSKLEELVLGSVSSEALKKNHSLPMWIVDGKIESQKILLPVDGSPETLQAVDHLAFIVADNPDAEITLFHSKALLANHHELSQEECMKHLDQDWCDTKLQNEETHLNVPEQILIDNGFPAERIKRLETSKGIYPSRQIVRQAFIDGFGTIVMGRRSSQKGKGLWGSVSEKVIAMSENIAVWIIG